MRRQCDLEELFASTCFASWRNFPLYFKGVRFELMHLPFVESCYQPVPVDGRWSLKFSQPSPLLLSESIQSGQ